MTYRAFIGVIGLALKLATPARGQAPARDEPPPRLSFNPDAGVIFQSGDFRATAWGYAERLTDPDGKDTWRRVRQGSAFDLPHVWGRMRPAIVYEIDLANSDFFRQGPFRRNVENLFISLQDLDNPGRFRLLFGHNTHILSREDNLSSGNLATINRSLILEEHGSVNAFGPQWGFQGQHELSPRVRMQFSVGDNRGSLNAADPTRSIGRSVAGKLSLTPIQSDTHGPELVLGLAADYTRAIGDRLFTLSTVIAQAPLGGVRATGNKLTVEGDVAYTRSIAGRPTTVEGEFVRSRFAGSRSDVVGGYAMVQVSLFDHPTTGDLDVFLRFDLVAVGLDTVAAGARQHAIRTGINYNLPFTTKLVSVHVEYAHNSVKGPPTIVTRPNPGDELRIELRASLQRYLRH